TLLTWLIQWLRSAVLQPKAVNNEKNHFGVNYCCTVSAWFRHAAAKRWWLYPHPFCWLGARNLVYLCRIGVVSGGFSTSSCPLCAQTFCSCGNTAVLGKPPRTPRA